MHTATNTTTNTTRRSATIGGRFGWLAVAAAVAATAALGTGVAGAEIGRTGPPASSAPATAGPSAPAVHADDVAVGLAYLACLRNVGRSADTQERWTDACRELAVRDATVAAFEARCLDGVSVSADTLAVWAPTCRLQAERDADAQLDMIACVRETTTADAMEHRAGSC
jgi:hypothetical protein